MKVYTVTTKFSMGGIPVVSSQSTTDMAQAMRFTASLAVDVESAMKMYGFARLKTLDVHISVKNVNEADIPEHPRKWFWCTLGGDPDIDDRDIPSGEDPIDKCPDYSAALDLASHVMAYKIDNQLFEYWPDVVEYCENKLGV